MRVPLVLAAAASTVAFTNLGPGLLRLPSTPPASAASRRRPRLASTPVSEMSSTMADIRKQMEEDEEVNLMMQGLRGANLNDDDNAAAGVTMRLVTTRDGGELPTYYSPDALRAHFRDRPGEVAQRVFQIATTSAGFLGTLLFDAATGRLESNEVGRAAELRDVITSLGPFFIKLGQALSIRPDLLSPRAMVELQQLCDKVPSYDSKLAYSFICEELGISDPSEVYSELTAEPIAAASLGQVYKGVLRSTGAAVAVKVQRPFVLETVSLDLYLARELGGFLKSFDSSRFDLVELLDEFASRFYDELDYVKEGENGIQIFEDMKALEMVKVPYPFMEATTRRVHTAEWIEGEKLSQSKADDVDRLINTGVIAYLTQLLDTGTFHADPHPGNMIRTSDGKLAILDFGLMTEITDAQKYGMIDAISHLIHRDYDRIGDDFVQLGFIPEGVDVRPIVPALARVFDAALAGGGAKSINFQELAADLAEITFKYPFRIPPFFALVIRAIGVLEGVALVGDPSFAIVDEAYPFIAKRLLSDDSPRLRESLRYMVYGQSGTFDVARMIDLLVALEKFVAVKNNDGEAAATAFKVDGVRGATDLGRSGDFAGSNVVNEDRFALERARAAAGPQAQGGFAAVAPLAAQAPPAPAPAPAGADGDNDGESVALRQGLRFMFSPEGAVLREFLLDELVVGVDALSRDALRELTASLGVGRLLPPALRALAPPLTPQDRLVVDNVRTLVAFLLQGGVGGAGGVGGGTSGDEPLLRNLAPQDAAKAARALRAAGPVLREVSPALREFGLKLVARLTERAASRAIRYATDSIFGSDAGRSGSGAVPKLAGGS